MLKRLLLVFCALMTTTSFTFAQVDVNKGDPVALNNIKGIGSATAKRIVDERKKNGNFKDWADFENRVSGIGEKSAVKLSKAGLLVNGKPKANESAANQPKGSAKPATKTK